MTWKQWLLVLAAGAAGAWLWLRWGRGFARRIRSRVEVIADIDPPEGDPIPRALRGDITLEGGAAGGGCGCGG